MNTEKALKCALLGGITGISVPIGFIIPFLYWTGLSFLHWEIGIVLVLSLPGCFFGGIRVAWFHLGEGQYATREYLIRFVPVWLLSFVSAIPVVALLSLFVWWCLPQDEALAAEYLATFYSFRSTSWIGLVVKLIEVVTIPQMFYWLIPNANQMLSRWGIWEYTLPKFIYPHTQTNTKRRERGTELITAKEAHKTAKGLVRKATETFQWGGLTLPMKLATQHFLVAGMTGSGKTLTLSSLMDSFIPTVKAGGNRRALVFDPKNEALSQIKASGADMSRVIVLNPFDSRCNAWDLAKDLTTPGHAREFASLLFPRETKNDPFWDDGPADLLEGAILSFNYKHPKKWDLRDLLLALSNVDDLREVLLWDEDINHNRLRSYFGLKRMEQNLLATLATKASHYRIIAACWHHAESKTSLEEWLKADGVLVFGHSDDYPDALREINRAIFRRVVQLLLREPDSEERKTFVFIDELGANTKLDLLHDLMVKGRSRGVSVAIGFQDIASLKETYGENHTEAITGQVGNKAILRLHGAMTTKWAERVFGDEEFVEQMRTMHIGDDYQRGWSEHREVQPIVRDSDFMSLPTPDKDKARGVTGYFQVWEVGSYRAEFPIRRPGSAQGITNFDPRDPLHQRLTRWTPEERKNLGLNPLPKDNDQNGDKEHGRDHLDY